MALLICPECGHKKVSEYASFCPKCGCPIEYIKDHYFTMGEVRPRITYRMSEDTLNFIKEIKELLIKHHIPFKYHEGKKIVGFKHNESDLKKFFFYLIYQTGPLYKLSIKNHREGKVFKFPYTKKKHDIYIYTLFKEVFDIDINAEVIKHGEITKLSQTTISNVDGPYNEYKFTVYQNKVESIIISEIDSSNKEEKIYYKIVGKDVERYCLISDLGKVIFKTANEAHKAVSSDVTEDKMTYYILKDLDTYTYFSGYHETRQSPSVFIGRFFTIERGHDVVYKVPNFAGNRKDAVKFTTYEVANKIKNQLEEVSINTEVVKIV